MWYTYFGILRRGQGTVDLDMSGKPRARQKMDEIQGNVRSDGCGIRVSES